MAKTAATLAVTAALIAAVSCTGVPNPSGSGTTPGCVPATPSGSASPLRHPGGRRPATPAAVCRTGPGDRPLGWGPQQRTEDAAARAVATMTVEQKAGQVLMPFFAGTDVRGARRHHRTAAPGGLDHHGGQRARGRRRGRWTRRPWQPGTARLAQAAPGRTAGPGPASSAWTRRAAWWPGSRAPLTEWPAPMSYGAAGNAALAEGRRPGLGLRARPLGFTRGLRAGHGRHHRPAGSHHRRRSMSGNPDAAASLGVAFSQGMQEPGVLPAAKHFPGHGSVTVDSHQRPARAAGKLARARGPRLEAVPGRHRRRRPHGHDGPHRRPRAGTGRSRRRCPNPPTRHCGAWASRALP